MYRDLGENVVIACIIAVIILTVIMVMWFGIVVPLTTQEDITLTVSEKESYTSTDCSSNGDGGTSCSTTLHMLVYTDGEVLQFENCLVLWKFDAQTDYSHIREGKYKFRVFGYSVPWLNWYRTVISYTRLEND